MKKDLLLRIRSEVLKRNIEEIRIKAHKPTLSDRYQKISVDCNTISESLDKILESLNALKTSAQRDKSIPNGLRDQLLEIVRDYDQVYRSFGNLADKVSSLLEDSSRYKVPVRDDVISRHETRLARLKSIPEDLDSSPSKRENAWKTYREEHLEIHRLLSEYVEFMGGLALRDVGFDEGICDFADELIPTYKLTTDKDFRSMTIPGRQETIPMTWARIVRMGYPEWSIWALPLAAHDLWYAMAQETIGAQQRIAKFDVAAKWIQECLADAYAVWATGPAYAYATVFLRLNPLSAFKHDGEHPSDDTRAYAILEMWERMNLEEPNNLPYSLDIKELTEEWQKAIEFAKPVGDPDKKRKSEFQEDVKGKEKLKILIPALVDSLKSKTLPGFAPKSWALSKGLAQRLLKGDQIHPGDAGFRSVLNAAWLARLERPEAAAIITKRCLDLWHEIAENAKRKTSDVSNQHRSKAERVGRSP
jgi:hypothetical protein